MADVKDLLIRMSLDSSTFKRNIQDAKNELRTLKAEYKAVASSDDIGRAGEKMLSNLQEQKTAAEALVKEYGKGIESLRSELQKATPGSQKAFQLEQQIQRLEKGLADARAQVNGLQQDIDGLTLEKFIKEAEAEASVFMNLRLGFSELLDGFGDAADSADSAFVSREAAFTEATKNVDAVHQTKEEMDALNASLRKMTTVIPMTYQELAALMGVGATNAVPYEDLEKFTEVMAKLNVATNVQGETGARMLAQLLNITEKDYKNIDRAGAALTELGNNSATTEQAILELAQRAATGLSAVGMGLDDILAISAALNSVGIEAQAGGSSVSKLAIAMDKAARQGGGMAEKFAEAMGMTAEDFSASWREDSARTMLGFFRALGEMDGTEAGGNMLDWMDELNITEIRQSNMVRALAGNWELYARMLTLGRDAYAENIALDNEARRAFATTESQRIMNANKAENANEALGKTVTAMRQPFDDFFADMRQGFAEMPELVQAFAAGTTEAIGKLGESLDTAGKLSFAVVNIANAVKDLETTEVGWNILRKMALINAPALGMAGTVALGAALDKASTEANWGDYNRVQAGLDSYMTASEDARLTRMQALLSGASQAMKDYETQDDPMKEPLDSLKEFFRQNANELLQEMPELNIWKRISDMVDLSDGLDQAEIEKAVSGLEFADQWLELGNEAVNGLAQGIKDREAELQAAAEEAGRQVDAGLSLGVDENASDPAASAEKAAQGVIAGAEGALGVQSPSTVFYGIGLNVDAGLAEGIIAGADQAIAAAQWLAGEIENTMRGALDIHSPSGVARLLGGYFAEGFAQGLEQGVSRVEKSMDRLTRAVTPRLDGEGNPVGRQVQVTVNMDGKTMAQALAPLMDTALGDLSWDMV